VADAFDAKVTLLHVMPSLEDEQQGKRPDPLGWEIVRREAEQYLNGIRTELGESGAGSRQVTCELTQGRPALRIATVARELDADLLVLATHGEGGLGDAHLGSTAQALFANASSSVLVVPPAPSTDRAAPVKRIMVALDGSLRTECVLPTVVHLSRAHDASVLLVHVVTEPEGTCMLSSPDDLALARSLVSKLEAAGERYLARLRNQLLPEVSQVETLVVKRTDQHRALLEVARERRVDLLVLAAHGVTCDATDAFGSVAAHALAHAGLPLLVLQDLPARERETPRSRDNSDVGLRARAGFNTRSLEEN
jgi:nucleotide-binding universal stress UspA family protein